MSRFLALPCELRDEILTYLIPMGLCFENWWARVVKKNGPWLCRHLPLLLINHQLHDEVTALINTHTTFHFEWSRLTISILLELRTVPDAEKARITRLSCSLDTCGIAPTSETWAPTWADVMRYVEGRFTSLRVFECRALTWETVYLQRYNWGVPRLAVDMLVRGMIEEGRWLLSEVPQHGLDVEKAFAIALKLLLTPYDEEKNARIGFQYDRLLKGEWELDGGDAMDRWAIDCLRRPKHELRVRRLKDCIVLTRR